MIVVDCSHCTRGCSSPRELPEEFFVTLPSFPGRMWKAVWNGNIFLVDDYPKPGVPGHWEKQALCAKLKTGEWTMHYSPTTMNLKDKLPILNIL